MSDNPKSEFRKVRGNDINPASIGGREPAESLSTDQQHINQLFTQLSYDGENKIISSGTVTKTEWDTINDEDTDIYSVDLTNNQISVNVEGLFLVRGVVEFLSDTGWTTGDRLILRVEVNGNAIDNLKRYQRKIETGLESLETIQIVKLNANDSITLQVFQDSGADKELNGRSDTNIFEVVKLG